MKALHIIQRYMPGALTGSEKAMAILCEALARCSDHEIMVITSNVDPGEGFYDPRTKRIAKRVERIEGVEVRRLPVNWVAGSFFYILNRFLPFIRGFRQGYISLQSFGPQLIGLEQAIVEERPTVMHASPLPMSHVLAAWRVARKHHIPFILTPAMHFEDQRFDRPLIRTILQQSDAVIAHTEYEKAQLIDWGVAEDKLAVIASSFLTKEDFQEQHEQSIRQQYGLGDRPVALFLGSKSFDKGVVHLLEAWPLVRRQVKDATLVIAGVSTKSWEEAKKSADLEGIIELDYVDSTLKQTLLSETNVLCVPSRAESFGMILLEAWAKKKPVIGGSAGATRELIEEGKNGYTVEFGDVAALADAIIRLLLDRTLAERLGRSGLIKAKSFTEDEIVRKTLEVYQRAITKKRA